MSKNYLSIESGGTEGPSYDPYAVQRITWTNNKGEQMTVHYGLNEYMILPNGQKICQCDMPVVDPMKYDHKRYLCTLWDVFSAFVGVSTKVLDRMVERELNDYVEDPMGGPGMYI